MKLCSLLRDSLRRCSGLALGLALAVPPSPAVAGLGAEPVTAPPAAPGAPAAVGGAVALLRFSGAEPANDLRGGVQNALEERGFVVKSVALDLESAAAKVKCKRGDLGDDCLARLAEWLAKNPKTRADYIVYGMVTEGPTSRAVELGVYDAGKKVAIKRLRAKLGAQDLILPLVLPRAVVGALADYTQPPGGPTPEEAKILAELDEPAKTPEELADEKRQLEEAKQKASELDASDILAGGIKVDLRADFKTFCRTGPRRKRKTREDPPDLRPKCSMGPVWGYWQPRAWVTLGLTLAAGATAVGLYGGALALHAQYKDSVSALEDFETTADREAGRDVNPRAEPEYSCVADGRCYAPLAVDVSSAGTKMQRMAITGDAVLGAAVFLAGVLAIIIHQDRTAARRFLEEEKGLRAISRVRFTPMVGARVQGAGFGFRF